MEDASMVFSVDSGDVSEDEDEIQRKEELHQLLSEQLREDLLDDSISTITSLDGEVSLISMAQHTPTKMNQSKTALNCSIPETMPHGHVIIPHDSDVIRPIERDPPYHEDGSVPLRESGEGHPLSPSSPLSLSGVDDTDFEPVGSMRPTGGIARHYGDQSDPSMDPVGGITRHHGDQSDASMDPARGITRHHGDQSDASMDPPRGITRHHSDQSDPSMDPARGLTRHNGDQSDVFSGTSQAYRGVAGREGGEKVRHFSEEYSLQQLDVLYRARGRRVEQLSQQLSSQAEEAERHICILRHEKEILSSERDQLLSHLSELEAVQESLEREVSQLRGQTDAEQTRSQALEGSRRELVSRLQTAEASIENLTNQVVELTSSESLVRVRESYSSALSEAHRQHPKELITFQQELEGSRRELEEKVATIAQLQSELQWLRSNYETQLEAKEQELRALRETPLRTTQPATDTVVQHLDFTSAEKEGEGEMGRLTARLVELSTRAEDLQFQLNTAEQELVEVRGRADETEVLLESKTSEVLAVASENEQLLLQLEALQEMVEKLKEEGESEKKNALEQCRSACLQLHEESTKRLRESIAAERQRTAEQHSKQMEKLRAELVAAQEQYVNICCEKEEQRVDHQEETIRKAVEEARKKWSTEREQSIQEAVSSARVEWRNRLDQESRASVEHALSHARGREVSSSREAWEREKEVAIAEALRSARVKWLEERESSIVSQVESAVSAAQRLWKEHHAAEMEKIRDEYTRQGTSGRQGDYPSVKEQQKLAVQEEVARAKQEWERKHSHALENAIRRTKEECATESAMSLELALASERGKLLDQSKKEWSKKQRSLLSSAHKEWSKAQEAVTRAEVERARTEWEEEQKNSLQSAVEEAVSRVKHHYEAELVRQSEGERERMALEINALEEQVARLMQAESQRSDCSVLTQSVVHADVRDVLQTTVAALKRDMHALLVEVQESNAERLREEVLRARQNAVVEVRNHYLRCLHQLVNGDKHEEADARFLQSEGNVHLTEEGAARLFQSQGNVCHPGEGDARLSQSERHTGLQSTPGHIRTTPLSSSDRQSFGRADSFKQTTGTSKKRVSLSSKVSKHEAPSIATDNKCTAGVHAKRSINSAKTGCKKNQFGGEEESKPAHSQGSWSRAAKKGLKAT